MGKTHVSVGALLGLALAGPLAHDVLHRTPTIGELAAFTGVTAGFALLPDLDHPQATLARTLGPATKLIATGVNKVSGGHRKGTHTVWMAGLMVGLITLLSTNFGRSAELPVAFVGFYLALMILRLAPRGTSGLGELVYAIEAAGLSYATYRWVGSWWWLPWAAGLGVIWHIVADCLTTEGVPLFFPLARRFVVRMPVLGHTDSVREHVFAFTLLPAIAWVALATATGHPWWTYAWVSDPSHWKVVA